MAKRSPGVAAAVAALLVAIAPRAQPSDAGTTAFEILHTTFGARELALAGASIGLPNDLDGFQSNPAALAYSEGMCTSVGLRSLVMDVWGAMAAFGMPIAQTGVWSLNLTSMSYGTVSEVVDDNGPRSTGRLWRSDAAAGSLSWARKVWTTLALGVSVKGVYHYIGTDGQLFSADGVAVDAGAQYRMLDSRLSLGVAVRNVGVVRSGYSDAYADLPLPLAVGGGLSYVPKHVPSLRMNVDVEKTRGEYLEFEPGLEVAVYKRFLHVRGGYAFSSRDAEEAAKVLGGDPDPDYQKSNWRTLCLGIGVNALPRGIAVTADAGVEFHVDAEPSVAVTVHIGGY